VLTFDGPNKLIIMDFGTIEVDAIDMYSLWKEWVQIDDNSKYLHAFTTAAGDPIGVGQTIAPYFFLNTTDGWRIRPHEDDHQLNIIGNLYSVDSTLEMIIPTIGSYVVLTIIERSSAAIVTIAAGRYLR